MDNPLLRDALSAEHVKPRLLGHWGTTPGLNFVYAHLNRVINDRDVEMIYANLHVRGYKEEGTTTTPFDMLMLNDLDRFHLVIDVIDRVPNLNTRCAHLRQDMVDARAAARLHTRATGEDPPSVTEWTWLTTAPERAVDSS